MTQLQTFDDTQKLIQKYGTRDPFELIDALPNTKLWSARLLDADGLRGFATIVNRVRYIAINPHLPYEEQRVIAGHELGHIFEHSNHLRCQAMQDFDIFKPPAGWKGKPISSPPICYWMMRRCWI